MKNSRTGRPKLELRDLATRCLMCRIHALVVRNSNSATWRHTVSLTCPSLGDQLLIVEVKATRLIIDYIFRLLIVSVKIPAVLTSFWERRLLPTRPYQRRATANGPEAIGPT